MKHYTICENCKKLFKLEAKMYIGNTPVPISITEEGEFLYDDETLIESHFEQYINHRRKLKVPTYITTYIFKTECPHCGHLGNHDYIIREREMKEFTIEQMIQRYRLMEEEITALRIELKRLKDSRDQRNPLIS